MFLTTCENLYLKVVISYVGLHRVRESLTRSSSSEDLKVLSSFFQFVWTAELKLCNYRWLLNLYVLVYTWCSWRANFQTRGPSGPTSDLTLIRMAIKMCVALWMGVIYASQVTNRKQGRLPMTAPLPPPAALLLITRESYTTPGRPVYRTTSPQTGGSLYILIRKSPKTAFLKINFFNKI